MDKKNHRSAILIILHDLSKTGAVILDLNSPEDSNGNLFYILTKQKNALPEGAITSKHNCGPEISCY